MKCEEAREFITALIDGELTQRERADTESHLGECLRCRSAYERERAVKKQIRELGLGTMMPAGLESRVVAGLDAVLTGSGFSSWSTVRWFPRPAFAVAVAAILVVTIFYMTKPRGEPVSVAVLGIQEKLASGGLALHTARDQDELRNWQINAVNGKFAPIGYFLSSMHFRPEGGLVRDIDGRRVLVTVFRKGGESVTCFTFLGSEADAPKDATTVLSQDKQIVFYAFSRRGYNAVLHREGDVICILVSKLPAEELLDLARDKAHHT